MRQWDLTVKRSILENEWEGPFQLRHAVVDTIYTAELCLARGLSMTVCESILNIALIFSYLLNNSRLEFGTQTIVRELVSSKKNELDLFIKQHKPVGCDVEKLLQNCIQSLPPTVRKSVCLEHFSF